MSAESAALRDAIAAFGTRFDDDVADAAQRLLAPHATRAEAGCQVERDIAYGPESRQRFDLYLPHAIGDARVVLYVPGGGFTGGDKALGGGLYGNVGATLAADGFLCAVMNHRLAPEAVWPAGTQDVAEAVRRLMAYAAAAGARSNSVGLVGHSAGATHVAGLLFDPAHKETAERVGAAALLSGFYDGETPMRPGPGAYFGTDPATWDARMPSRLASTGHAPLLLAFAAMDPPAMAAQTLRLALRLTELDRVAPPLVRLAGHNHVSTVFGIGSPIDDASPVLRDFFEARL